MSRIKHLNRIRKGVGIAIATPVVLFFILAILIYLPPVQSYVKDKATRYLSEKTGTEITIDNVRLYFPLDLNLNGTRAVQRPDTLLSAKTLRLGIRILPLFQGKIALDELFLSDTDVNTKNLISDTQIKGHIGLFDISIPAEYSLTDKFLELGTVKLYNSKVDVLLNDTARQDTTTSEKTEMEILLHRADVQNTRIFLQFPGDSMCIGAEIGKALIDSVKADIGKNIYTVSNVQLSQSAVNYDVPYEAYQTSGLDYNHISVSDLLLKANQIKYNDGKLMANIAALSFAESKGLQVDNLTGHIVYDNDRIKLPDLMLKTPQTTLSAKADIAMNALQAGTNGKMDVKIAGFIGRKDLELIVGDAISNNKDYYPDEPLNIKAHITGNVDRAEVHEMQVKLGKVVDFEAKGVIRDILSGRRGIDLDYKIKAGDISPLRKLIPDDIHVPSGLQLGGKFKMAGDNLIADAILHSGNGRLNIKGEINTNSTAYDLTLDAHQFPLRIYLPGLPLSPLTAVSHLKGRGFDFKDNTTVLESQTHIQYLTYDKLPFDNIKLDADMKNGQLEGRLISQNPMLTSSTAFVADITPQNVRAIIKGDIEDLALQYLIEDVDSLHLMMNMGVTASAAFDGSRVDARGLLKHLNIITSTTGYPTDSVGFRIGTSNDSTYAYLRSGDLLVRFFSPGGINTISQSVTRLTELIKQQIDTARIDQNVLQQTLPTLEMHVKAGHFNPIAQLLDYYGYTYDKFRLDLKSVQGEGINGTMNLNAFRTGDLLLEKTTASLMQDSANLKLACTVANTSRKNPNRFNARLDGELLTDGFSVKSVINDSKNVEGLNLGIRGELSPSHDITLHIFPRTSTIAYRKFKVNDDNFITIKPNQIILADIDLLADDHTGLKVNAMQQDSVNDITVSLSKVNIDELCSVVPYMPNMGGFLSGDIHVIKQNNTLSASGAIDMEQFRYETYNMGDFGAEVVFLPQDSDYYVNALILNKSKEVANIDGTYSTAGGGILDAVVNLEKFPGEFLNAFLPSDGTLELKGNLDGSIAITGPTSRLIFNGDIMPDSLHVLSPLYGVNLSMEDKPLHIKESCIYLDSITMYSANNPTPLTFNGNINFSNLDKIMMDIAVKAKKFLIVNSEKTKTSLLYGKVFSDIDATVKGSTDFMFIRGNLHVLGKTDMTYIMKDGPLTVDDWLSGLVEFEDFNDTTDIEQKVVESSKMLMVMNVKIDEKSKIRCELSADGNSYFNCKGGGNLTMKYLPSGNMTLLGRFNLKSGEMKYELPFIPLKTFKLSGENYITFTGKPFNPTLNIKAMETTRAGVSDGSSATRMVTFNVGVAISQTLENMGLRFLIEAPSDMNVQNDLASMSEEERGKVAVTMLATGMYYSSNNKSSFKANNALNAFLQSEIQNVAGNAFKTLDLTVGMEGSTSAAGNAQTDYSFQFSKHLWNDRVTFVIGGKVTAGAEDASRNQSFIDNISLEYRLDSNSTRNLRLFYDNDTQDPLEGYYSTAGVGFVLRSKTNSLGELFLKPRKKTKDDAAH